jgi:hypothetical protein
MEDYSWASFVIRSPLGWKDLLVGLEFRAKKKLVMCVLYLRNAEVSNCKCFQIKA